MKTLEWLNLLATHGSLPTPACRLNLQWSLYLDDSEHNPLFDHQQHQIRRSERAMQRQAGLAQDVTLSETEIAAIKTYTFDSNLYVNHYLRQGQDRAIPAHFFPDDIRIDTRSAAQRAIQLYRILQDKLPRAGPVTLYRGGHGGRGTSGQHFRCGMIRPGDLLVNSDFLSFTENPFSVANFCKPPQGRTDMSSVVFILTQHHSARIIAPYTMRRSQCEDESLFAPHAFFTVQAIDILHLRIREQTQPLVAVHLGESAPAQHRLMLEEGVLSPRIGYGPRYFDFRSGAPFDYERLMHRMHYALA